ncbi:MAG: electron transfer flavoprotein subunit beta/FixA family protein [Proteobacteria bacterium]|nr:electron transfer flavoprotein subunit beta/FixA family protein [Pseudomonadota bacterium]
MMNFIVCLKQIVDLQQVRIKKDTREAVLEGLPFLFSDMDMNALEAAVGIREKDGGKVIALCIGNTKLNDTIKDALARGADEAVLIIDPVFDNLDSRGKAEVLATSIQKMGHYDAIFMGEGSADSYSGQTCGRLAELLDIPEISYVSKLEFTNGKARATRSMDDCYEVVESSLPAMLTFTSEINSPRIPSLMQIVKAGKKPVQLWKGVDLNVPADKLAKEVELVSNIAPAEQRKMLIFEGEAKDVAASVVDSLIKEGVLGR